MRISILASGSNGNATCISTNNESFLIDDGLSFKMLYSRMEETNNNIHEVSSIFITHATLQQNPTHRLSYTGGKRQPKG